MMMLRSLLLATALFVLTTMPAFSAGSDDTIAVPLLRANVSVSADVVRVGDLIDNAGTAALVAVYRAPDLGTTGMLPVTQVISVLRQHQVIGVDTHDLKEVSVTRLARSVTAKDIQAAVAEALAHRGNLGEAANINLTFDRDLADLRLDSSNSGSMEATTVRYEGRGGHFDVTFTIANDTGSAPTQLRFTGI